MQSNPSSSRPQDRQSRQREQDYFTAYDRRELEELFARLETQTREAEASKRTNEEFAREVEANKRRNEELAIEIELLRSERTKQNCSNSSNSSDGCLWVPELVKQLVSQSQPRENRNKVDSAIDALRNKTHDVES